jgi:hypothetical protein
VACSAAWWPASTSLSWPAGWRPASSSQDVVIDAADVARELGVTLTPADSVLKRLLRR